MLSADAKGALLLDGSTSDRSSGSDLLDSMTITIFALGGPSKGLKHQLAKPRTSIGQTGGGADVEIDDHKASVLHCVVDVSEGRVRLYDLDSTNGTYINEERIQAASLDHFSEFCIGSTVFLLTIVSKRLL